MPLPLTTYIPSVTALTEQTILSYVSSSLYNGGIYSNGVTNITGSLIDPTTEFYTGIANTAKQAPAVLVACDSAQETYFQTRVYKCNVDISTRMIAYDSGTSDNITSSAISFGGNVASLFGDTNLATQGINALQTGLAVLQLQVLDYQNAYLEDAWISNTTISLVATLVNN